MRSGAAWRANCRAPSSPSYGRGRADSWRLRRRIFARKTACACGRAQTSEWGDVPPTGACRCPLCGFERTQARFCGWGWCSSTALLGVPARTLSHWHLTPGLRGSLTSHAVFFEMSLFLGFSEEPSRLCAFQSASLPSSSPLPSPLLGTKQGPIVCPRALRPGMHPGIHMYA